MLKLKHRDLADPNFQRAVQTIAAQPTHGERLKKLHRIVKALDEAGKVMRKGYKEEVVEKYAKRDAEGKVVRPAHDPVDGFEPDDDKVEELNAAHLAFGEREMEIDTPQITWGDIGEHKLCPQDIKNLGSLFLEGPGLKSVQA